MKYTTRIMVHAAVYDPALLKEKDKIVAVTTVNSSFKLSSGVVTFDQHVRYFGPTLSIGGSAKVVVVNFTRFQEL